MPCARPPKRSTAKDRAGAEVIGHWIDRRPARLAGGNTSCEELQKGMRQLRDRDVEVKNDSKQLRFNNLVSSRTCIRVFLAAA
jgi:hypothetical protein